MLDIHDGENIYDYLAIRFAYISFKSVPTNVVNDEKISNSFEALSFGCWLPGAYYLLCI